MTNTAQKRKKNLQVSNYVTSWNQTVQHKFLIFPLTVEVCPLFFFLPLLVFFSVLSHRKPLPYHITLCLRKKKSKTQNMGQIYISLLLRSVTKNEIYTRKRSRSMCESKNKSQNEKNFNFTCCLSLSPFFRLGREEKVLHGIPFRWSQEFPNERRNWKVKKMLRVTAADCCLWLRCFLSKC